MLNKNSPRPKVSKLFLSYDVYERHKKVGALIDSGQTVLDVGGHLGYLSEFCRPAKITVANLKSSIEKSDVIIKKDKLPFENDSFGVVTAIDVLEHMPKDTRRSFTRELKRVAQKKIILSFPMGTPKHIAYEKHLVSRLAQRGEDVIYLMEHIKYGLPKEDEIEELTGGTKSYLTYSGDLKVTDLLFKIHLFDPKIPIIRRFIYISKIFFNMLANPILYFLLSDKIYSSNVVRAYLVIEKR